MSVNQLKEKISETIINQAKLNDIFGIRFSFLAETLKMLKHQINLPVSWVCSNNLKEKKLMLTEQLQMGLPHIFKLYQHYYTIVCKQ